MRYPIVNNCSTVSKTVSNRQSMYPFALLYRLFHFVNITGSGNNGS
jgi:hypothetical protein